MCIEHCDCLSWFSGLRESHEQDGERLSFAKSLRIQTASGDPAMAIGPSSDADGHRPVASKSPAFGCGETGGGFLRSATKRAEFPRANFSAANTQPLNQLL